MEEESKIKTYDDGVKDGANECDKRMKEQKCLDSFSEGYKTGFRDGYKAGREDAFRICLSQMPQDIRKQIEDGAQTWGPWW